MDIHYKHFCCPQCGNKNHLQITTQTDVNTTGKSYSAGKGCLGYFLLGPLGLLCGACGNSQKTTVKETKYWVCPNCGNKFESPDDLRVRAAEILKSGKVLMGFGIFMVVLNILMFVTLTIAGDEVPQGVAPILSGMVIIPNIIIFVSVASIKKSGNKLIAEADMTESSMSKFAGYNTTANYVNQPAPVQFVQPAPVIHNYTCPCGNVNSPDAKFCSACGRPNTMR